MVAQKIRGTSQPLVAKTLELPGYIKVVFFVFLSAPASVLSESEIKLLADPYCVSDGNSLPEPWGGGWVAQQALCTLCTLCMSLARKSGLERGAPDRASQQPKSSAPFNPAQRRALCFRQCRVCVCVFQELRHQLGSPPETRHKKINKKTKRKKILGF